MLVSSFNLSQSINYTPYLFYKKPVQIRDKFFLYMDLVERLCFLKERNATRSTAWNTKLCTSPSTRGSAPPNTTPRQQQQQQQQKTKVHVLNIGG